MAAAPPGCACPVAASCGEGEALLGEPDGTCALVLFYILLNKKMLYI